MEKCRPFHESIVDVIKVAKQDGLRSIAMLLTTTVIPENHVVIAGAWEVRLAEVELRPDIWGNVPQVLRKQAEEAREKEKREDKIEDKKIDVIVSAY